MRVAHVLRKYDPSEWGGTETALQRLTEGLGRHGVESIVFCPALGPGRDTGASDPLAVAGCVVKRFRATVPVWGLTNAARRQMLAVGGNLLSFELPRLLAREPGLDVVHAHTLGRLGGIALTAARRRRLPGVVTIHGGVLDLPGKLSQELNAPVRSGLEWGRIFGWWWRARHVLTDADAILTCNQREAGLLRQKHPDRRIIVQPHGVHLPLYRTDQRAAARAAWPQIAGRTLLLCLGRIDPVKNQTWLVERAPQVFQRHPDALLVLAGACTDAAYGAALQRAIGSPGLAGRVLLTGGLPPGDPRLVGLLQEARVVVLPSISETFGLVILEAWAAGTPVLASRTSGASALISHGENGWLFDLANPLSFHSALNRILAETALAAHQTAAGTRLVEQEYDTAVLAGRMQQLYAGLIGKKMRYIILRDDDTNALTPAECLERLYRPWLDRGLPVNLATIPHVRTDARRADGRPEGFLHGRYDVAGSHAWIGRNRELVGYLRQNPAYHIVQHGYDHSLYEFASHDTRDLTRRLDKGAQLLAEAGFPPSPAFVAPHDRFSPESLRVVARRFRVISTGWFEWLNLPPEWWPAYVVKKLRKHPHWRTPRTLLLSHPGCLLSRFRPREGLLEKIKQTIAERQLTVLVTHWWEYFPDGRPDAEFIGLLHRTADYLASEPDLRVISFAELARNPVPLD